MKRTLPMPTMASVEKFRAQLETPRGVFGPFMITSDPAFVEAAGYAGYDFCLLDMEHGPGNYETLQNLIRAANVAGIMPVVRVPRGTDIMIGRALDVGAGGVMIPQIETAQEARDAVSAAKFSPGGTRGTCRFVRSACYGALPGEVYFQKAQDTVVILQIEGQKAIENLEEILDVPGIDIIFVGPYDLSSSLGIIGQINHPKVTGCIRDIALRAKAKGVKTGCFADSASSARKLRDMGAALIGYSCDTAVYCRAAAEDVSVFQTI